MKNTLLILAAFSLTACGAGAAEEACVAYMDAVDECYVELGIDNPAPLADDYCDAYTEDSQADYMNCLADAYGTGDCSTDEGLTAIATEMATCVP